MDLLIWDVEETPPSSNKVTIYWSRSCDEKNSISITKYVEENSDELRSQYLEWIYDLGGCVIDGKKVVEHLLIRKNFSYWWLSSVTQKVNIDKSQNINDSIKLLGLEKYIKKQNPNSIQIVSRNFNLIKIIEKLCIDRDIIFTSSKSRNYFKNYIDKGLITITALIYLGWFFIRSVPIMLQKKEKLSTNNNVVFIDIFTHIYSSAYKNHQFKSYYWEDLVAKLQEWNIKTNWLHIYYKNNKNKSYVFVKKLCSYFSKNSKGMEKHFLLESNISIELFYQIIKDYLKIRKQKKLISKLKKIKPKESNLDLWAMHSQDFHDSILGKELVKNCILIALFEESMKKIPKQSLGIYISENQPWELALIHAWKSGGHGTLVGAPHNTLRYWDLRHHFDRRTYSDFEKIKYPMPNFLAINSPMALKNLICSGYPRNKLTEVEGLRYLYLLNEKEKKERINSFTILVCSDYQEKNTIKILDWLSSIKEYFPRNAKIIFRPHPIYKVNIKKYLALNLLISKNQLLQDFSSADFVLVGLISSVAADAYAYGLPVFQILDGSQLNMSPLRSNKNVNFVSSKKELLNILKSNKPDSINNEKFFYLDKNLLKWKKIIDINVQHLKS